MLFNPATESRSVPLLFVNGEQKQLMTVETAPLTIGRRLENDLVISHPSVSRNHAQIIYEAGSHWIIDTGSKHGTCVNGHPILRQRLHSRDRVTFAQSSAALIYDYEEGASARDLLNELSILRSADTSELAQLKAFLEVVRSFDATRALDEVFTILIEFALQVTKAERGFLFLADDEGQIRLVTGRTNTGVTLSDDSTISRSLLHEAAVSGSEFIIRDTHQNPQLKERHSIVAHHLRSIVCLPLRKRVNITEKSPVWGVVYLDSHALTSEFTNLGHDILRALANDAAGLVEHVRFAEAEQRARRYEQELAIAGEIQRQLLSVRMPECEFASVRGCSVPCTEVGGDFYDVMLVNDKLYFVFADVSGKGISAALLASVLQGVTSSNFLQERPLVDTASAANELLCGKHLEARYATLIAGCLHAGGELEIVNCGHLPPLYIAGSQPIIIESRNLPVGFFPAIHYQSQTLHLQPGDRVVLVSDGITEAENGAGDFFGEIRLCDAALSGPPDAIYGAVRRFCGALPLADDCSVLELGYTRGMRRG